MSFYYLFRINIVLQLLESIKLETNNFFSFDFCITIKQGNTVCNKIIELDGMQHFKFIKYWKNCPEEALKRDFLQNGMR